ncbi:hypothetical protein JCM3774_002165 [Rhodotorula dairenensis]
MTPVRLPEEILDRIFRIAFPSIETEHEAVVKSTTAARAADFSRPRNPIDERALVDAIPRCGTAWLSRFRAALFHAPHVSTRQRAGKLLKALELAQPGRPESKGYLTRHVRRLCLDIRPRPLPDKLDPTGKYDYDVGLTARHISRLAAVLPQIGELVINTSEGGDHWLCGPDLIEAVRQFGGPHRAVSSLEITGSALGCQNALHAFADGYPNLRALRLKNLAPGWTTLVNLRAETDAYAMKRRLRAPFPAFARLETLVLWDCTLAVDELSDLLASLGPGHDGTPSHNSRFPLRHLTLHHLKVRQAIPEQTTRRCPFPPEVLQAHLVPLVPHLESLHLVLYDRDPYASRARGMASQLATPPRPQAHDYRPGDVIAALIGPHFRDLTLGGPYCVSEPAFFEALDNAVNRDLRSGSRASRGPGRLCRLTLTQCANRGNGEGISIQKFTSALDGDWAQSSDFVELDLHGMDPNAEDSDGEETPLWCGPALDALVAKVDDLIKHRARFGVSRLHLRVNETARGRSGASRSAAQERRANARRPPKKRTQSSAARAGGGGSPSKKAGRSKSA